MSARYKRPDAKNAESIALSAEKEMKFTLSLKISAESGSTIVRNIYECFRKLGGALLIAKGVETHDHVQPLHALMQLSIKTARPIRVIETLRTMRHNINYYGYIPKESEVNDALDIAKTLFAPCFKAVLQSITRGR